MIKMKLNIPLLFLAGVSWLGSGLMANDRQKWDTYPDTWVATDGLGRELPGYSEVGPPREDRFVGIFYFLWLGQHGTGGPYNITEILRRHPDAMETPASPPWGELGEYHHWHKPLFGYYLSDDRWVIRRHAQMLADAGVDTLIFDVTNNFPYTENYLTLLEVFDEVRRDGGDTPQVTFLTPFAAPGKLVERLYEDLYGPGRYEDLWFHWEGKPLLMADPEGVDPGLRDFFTFRKPEPSYFEGPTGPDMWSWLEVYPQHVFRNRAGEAEQMAVGVGQNAVGDRLAAFSEAGARGRSYSYYEGHPGDMRHTAFGINFAEQFDRALEHDPRFIFITGWNEWVSMRHDEFNNVEKPVMFVDVFDEEYTRDIEPVDSFTRDFYYSQLVDFIRRYKGVRKPPFAGAPKTLPVHADFSQWEDVDPEFRDDAGDTTHRDHPGWGEAGPYRDDSGRNDFVLMKVAHDQETVYFYARTREAITGSTDPNWMWLLINTDGDSVSGWEGYNFIVNRSVADTETTWLEVSSGGWKWHPVVKVDYRVEGNEMQLAIPRKALGLPAVDGPLRFDFKWADNLQREGDVIDFLISGDVAPNGRFNYRYAEEAAGWDPKR